MSRIEELREPVQPIALKLRRWGFKLTDVTSVGLLMIKDWDANKIAKFVELLSLDDKSADDIVSSAEADAKELRRKKLPRDVELG